MNVREIVFSSLLKCEKSQSYPNIEIDSAIEKNGLSGNERSFYTALVYGVIEKKITLDYIISKYSKIPLKDLDVETLNILRLGIYQLYFLDKIPDYSATDESVSLAPKKSKGFVI